MATVLLSGVPAAPEMAPAASTKQTTGLVVASAASGRLVDGLPQVHKPLTEPSADDPYIETIASDGAGGWYVGGDFTMVGKVRCQNLVHLIPHRAMSKALCLPTNGVVLSLARAGETLFVGGMFTRIAGVQRNYLAKVDIRSSTVEKWDAHMFGRYPGPQDQVFPGLVQAIAVRGSVVFVGGAFQRVGSSMISNVAALDANTAAPVRGWAPPPRVANGGVVVALAEAGGRLLVGGDPLGLVALDSRTGRELPNVLPRFRETLPYIGGLQVHAIAVTRSSIYVGGQFSEVGTTRRTAVVALDSRTFRVTNWSPGFPRVQATPGILSNVSAIAVGPGRVYLAGDFTRNGKTELSAAAFDANTGRTAFWSFGSFSVTSVDAVAVSRGLVAFGPGLCKSDQWGCSYPASPA